MATFQDKLDRITKGIQANTSLSNLVPGTKMYQMSQSTAYEGMLLQQQIEDYAAKNSILTAKGPDLDDIGNNVFGIQRFPDVKPFVTESMKCLKFYVQIGTFGDINRDSSNMPSDIILPEGVTITGTANGNVVSFRINKAFTLPASSSEMYVSAEMIQGPFDPISSNSLTSHNFQQYTQVANKLLLVTNPTTIGSGRLTESDDNFRYRLSKTLKAFPRTTYYGIYDAALSVAGVSKVILIPSSNGGGTFTIYVQGVTPITGDEIIANVKAVITNIVPPWVEFNVLKFFGVGLSLGITVRSSSINANIPISVSNALASYINNYYGSQIQLNTLLNVAAGAYPTIFSAEFDYVNIFTGDVQRSISTVDLGNANPTVYLSEIEKLIVEPVLDSIVISQAV